MDSSGGIILCGGQSLRMGLDKAWLPFGAEPLLARVARIASRTASPLVVVGQTDQRLPALAPEIIVRADRAAARGPLEGLATGLATIHELGGRRAFLCACDMPLLDPAVIAQLVELSHGHEAAAIEVDGHLEPLCAVYSVALLPKLEQLLASGAAGPSKLLAMSQVRRVALTDFARPEAAQSCLQNINTLAEYHAALAAAGLPIPHD